MPQDEHETHQPVHNQDFPVEWEDPADAELLWRRNSHPVPAQTQPLEHEVFTASIERAVETVTEHFGQPAGGMRSRLINTFAYSAQLPPPGTPEEQAAQTERSETAIYESVRNIGPLWEQEWLPEIRDHLAAMERFDGDTSSIPTLRVYLDELMERVRRLWELHMLIVIPAYVAVSEFDEFYRDLFSPTDPFAAYRLVRGLPTKTFESGQALWELSRTALKTPEVAEQLRQQPAADVVSAMECSEHGRAFLRDLEVYLQEYGQRNDTMGISRPSWIEDPVTAIRNIQNYLDQPEEASPTATLEESARQREETIHDARQRLVGYPQPIVDQFEELLTAAQIGNVLTEDHNFYIDCRSMYQARRPFVAAGNRLAEAGVLERTDDVFLLSIDQLYAALESFPHRDFRDTAAARRAEMERFRHADPPDTLGNGEAPPPPSGMMGRFMAKFGGIGVETPVTDTPADAPADGQGDGQVLNGAPGSPGSARGTVRVLWSLDEADRVERGDILVAPNTAPAWTPLFASAGAVVTDAGGILSHCAVVAREYGIPAVVGTSNATATLTDGQTVEVDGNTGTVHPLPAAERIADSTRGE